MLGVELPLEVQNQTATSADGATSIGTEMAGQNNSHKQIQILSELFYKMLSLIHFPFLQVLILTTCSQLIKKHSNVKLRWNFQEVR